MRCHDNRDRSRCPHGGLDRWDKMGDDDIDTKPDELFGILLGTIALPIGVAELYLNVLTLRISERPQTDVEVTQTQALLRGALLPAAARAPRAAMLPCRPPA